MVLKATTARDENLDMSDLSNLLGAVYGETDPDGPPVRHEAPASERMEAAGWGQHIVAFESPASSGINDDDIASALSAALMDAAPVASPAPAPAFEAPAPVVSLIETPAPAPMAPAPEPVFAAPAQSTWSNAATAVVAPPVAAVTPPRLWIFGDDDIFPGAKGGKGKKGRR
jgi:hypothetical protein